MTSTCDVWSKKGPSSNYFWGGTPATARGLWRPSPVSFFGNFEAKLACDSFLPFSLFWGEPLKSTPRGSQEAPRVPQEVPERSLRGAKRPPKGSKRLPRDPKRPPRRQGRPERSREEKRCKRMYDPMPKLISAQNSCLSHFSTKFWTYRHCQLGKYKV